MVPDHRLNSLTLYRQYKVRKEIPSKYHCEKSKPPEWWHTETYPWGAFLFIVCINAFGKRKKKVHGWSVNGDAIFPYLVRAGQNTRPRR
jgi:hypothetical protein